MDWINKINMITEKMKNQMHSRGVYSLNKVYSAIFTYDTNNSGYVEKIFFEEFLSRIGVFLKSQELTEIHKYLSTAENENRVYYENFVNVLKCAIPESFIKLILEVFLLIQEGNGTISTENLKGRIRLDAHLKIKLRQEDKPTVQNEINTAIDFIVGSKEFVDETDFVELLKNMYWVTSKENSTNLFKMIPNLFGCSR